MSCIYKITNKINNKVYIGQTKKTIEERFQEHLKKAKIHTNRYLYDAMNKYGYNNFQVSKIEECDNTKLDEREIYWIAFYKSNNKKYGYNMTAGGGGGDTWTNNPHKEETSKKLSQAQKGKKHKMSIEWKQNISKSNKKKKTIQIDKDELKQDIKNYVERQKVITNVRQIKNVAISNGKSKRSELIRILNHHNFFGSLKTSIFLLIISE